MGKFRYLYRDFVRTLSDRFEQRLSGIQYIHSFDSGDEFEVAICKTLRDILPQKFGICRGHVVDKEGNEAGDDIIIYDRLLYPTLRALGDEQYARKEWIPIEAVYAYIEAKHTLLIEADEKVGNSLSHACSQIGKVKRLCEKRARVEADQITRDMRFGLGQVRITPILPGFRNPLFAMVLSRFVKLKRHDDQVDDATIKDRLLSFNTTMTDINPPDLIVAGSSHVVLPIRRFNDGTEAAHFFDTDETFFDCNTIKDVAFGFGLCVLLPVLDNILLGTMPWSEILNDCLEK